MKLAHRLACTISISLSISFFADGAFANVAAVKLSSSGICHTTSSPWYDKVSRYTAFNTVEECLTIGRLPRSSSAPAPTKSVTTKVGTNGSRVKPYDRNAFGGWADADGDCLNTRHEYLLGLSTGPVRFSSHGCSVVTGKWFDPYTGMTFQFARDMDVDHLVPLAYAWSRGADLWSPQKRQDFANDPANLFAVDATTNRSKGAMGPTEWLPPDQSFHCQYLLRFQRVVKIYDLHLSRDEKNAISRIRTKACGK